MCCRIRPVQLPTTATHHRRRSTSGASTSTSLSLHTGGAAGGGGARLVVEALSEVEVGLFETHRLSQGAWRSFAFDRVRASRASRASRACGDLMMLYAVELTHILNDPPQVWGPDMENEDVALEVEAMALSVLEGQHACILAYGQTGCAFCERRTNQHKAIASLRSHAPHTHTPSQITARARRTP